MRETPENKRNSQSQNKLDPGMAQENISQVSEEIEGRVTKKLSKEFSRTMSRILGALSKFDEFLLNSQVRTCFVAVPETFRNKDSENREPIEDRSLFDPYPEAVLPSCHPSNLKDSEQDGTHHSTAHRQGCPSKTLAPQNSVPVNSNQIIAGVMVRPKRKSAKFCVLNCFTFEK